MLNIPNLPDLGEVKAQVDRIDANVADVRARMAELSAKIDDIHLVFQALGPIVAGMPPAGAPLVPPYGIISA